MKKIFTLVILLSMGITQIYTQPCLNCDGTTASGDKATSIGYNTTASGLASFAGGNSSNALYDYSFAFGNNAKTMGLYSIAFGNNAVANFADGIAIGNYATSNAANSLVFGTGTSLKPLINTKPNSIMFGVTNLPSLTIVKPTNGTIGYLGIGTDTPEEMAHVVGTLLIDRTETTASSLQFKYTELGFGNNNGRHFFWDIFTDDEGLRFNTITNSVTNQAMVITGSGSVGIGKGVTRPQAKLHVDQNILAEGEITTLDKIVLKNNVTVAAWEIFNTGSGLNFAYMDNALRDVLFMSNRGSIGIGTTNPSAMLDVNGTLKATSATIPTITGNTNVIGTLSANLLSAPSAKINGLICAEEIRVQLTGAECWPDYVFSKDYKLLSLGEVEQFITENQHLPNIPSSAEVEANGVELGAMNAKLLQKVEELTLYIIQMEKRVAELENKKGGE